MSRKLVGGALAILLILVGASFYMLRPKEINGTTEPIVPTGRWYQGEVIHILGYPDYDIIYVLGNVYVYFEIHVTIIRQMPSTFIITLNGVGDHIKLGDTLYKIVAFSVSEGWIEYEIS